MLCRKKKFKKKIIQHKYNIFFFLKIKMLYNIKTTFKKKKKNSMFYNIKKKIRNLNSGSDDGCDGNKTLFFCQLTQNVT